MDKSSFLIWNVRGLNDKARRDNLRKVVDDAQPAVVCLQETKLSHISERDIISFLGQDSTSFVFLPAQQTCGGILIAWRDSSFTVSHHRVHRHSVSVQFSNNEDPAWWFTGVYGPQRDDEKLHFLEELRKIHADCPGPWMLAGDFNMIYCSKDKNNENINRAMMGRFRRFVNDFDLKEIPLLGRRYTWSNERDSPTLVKLDRVLCTNDWEEIYSENVLQSHATEMSDHCPLILGLREGIMGKRGFTLRASGRNLRGFMKLYSSPRRNRLFATVLLKQFRSS
jgi:exonuclease III